MINLTRLDVDDLMLVDWLVLSVDRLDQYGISCLDIYSSRVKAIIEDIWYYNMVSNGLLSIFNMDYNYINGI